MVKKLCLLSLLVCVAWSGWAAAGPRLQVKADKKSVVLGEPLIVEIKADDVHEPLSSIKLEKLKQNFNVYGISSNVRSKKINGRTVTAETMSLTLYPLRSGKVQLPALSYMGKTSVPLAVSVLESEKQTSPAIFKTAIDSARPMVRQAATLTLDIYDDGNRQWTAPQELAAVGIYQRKLAESQSEELVAGVRYTVHRYAWAIMPLREGKLTVEFPMLDAFKFGTRLRYPLASLQLEAAAAPAYLPVYVPIGKPVVTIEALPAEIALNRPLNRVFSVSGSGFSAEGLSKLLSATGSNDSIRFYPLKIGTADNERPTSAVQTLLVTLPFVPTKAGMLKLPEINLPYYDPESARVEDVLIPAIDVRVFNPLWHSAGLIALGLVVLGSVGGAGYWMVKYSRRILKKRKYLLAIGRARSAGELRSALLNFGGEIALMHGHTLQQWLQYMHSAYTVDERLTDLVQQIDSLHYGTAQADITMLSSAAVKLLSKLPDKQDDRLHTENKSLFLTLFRLPVRS